MVAAPGPTAVSSELPLPGGSKVRDSIPDSPGCVEARNAAGELYGFERLQALAQARKSAEQIVEAACVFGQEDDITVLSIRRLAAAEEPAEARMNLTAQIATV